MASYGSVVPATLRHAPSAIHATDDDDASPLLPMLPAQSNSDVPAPPAPLSSGLAAWSSWWSVIFFSWCEYLTSLCAERPLRVEDIWTLDKNSTSLVCLQQFKAAVERTQCVIRAFYASQVKVLLASGLLTLASSACELISPIAVFFVVDAAANHEFETIYSRGTVWTAILLLARFLRSFLLGWADFILNYALVRATNPLSLLLLESVLLGKRYRRGRHANDEATNLFANDTKTVAATIKVFHRMWSLPLELIGLFYIFGWLIGNVMTPVFVACLMLYIDIQLLNIKETSLLRQWLEISDTRFSKLHDIFDQILGVKLHVWQDQVLESVEAVRRDEQRVMKKHTIVRTIRLALTWAAPSFNLVATGVILAYIPNRAVTTPAQTFAAVVIFHDVNEAFTGFVAVLRTFLELRVSLDRIEAVVPVGCRASTSVGLDFLTRETNGHQSCGGLATSQASSMNEQHSVGFIRGGDRLDDAVVLANASFTDPAHIDDHQPLLDYVSLRVQRGEFVVIHGKVGSGKSVLLAAIAGLLHKTKGSMNVRGSIAYCSQSPWIQSTTVRENVLFGRTFDPVKYWNVLRACDLLADIQSLPRGDQTLVGSRSYVSLSTGQQSRLALARACYADADLYVLDSPLDSVDSIVQCEILVQCFGRLLQHKTIVLATHNPEVIVSEYVDRAIQMENMEIKPERQEGSCSGGGSGLNQNYRQTKPFQRSSGKSAGRAAAGSGPAHPPPIPVRFVSRRAKLLAPSDRFGRQHPAVETHKTGSSLVLDTTVCLHPQVLQIQSISTTATIKTEDLATQDPAAAAADQEPRRQRGQASSSSAHLYRECGWKSVIKEYLSYSHDPWKLCIVVALHFLTQVLATCSIYCFSRWMSQYSILRGHLHNLSCDEAFAASMGAFHLYVALVVASAVSFFLTAYATFAFSSLIANRLFKSLTTSLLHARMSFYAETTVGKLLNRYCRDLRAVDSTLQDSVFALLKTFFGCYCALFASLGWMSGHVLKSSVRTGPVAHSYSEMETIGLEPITSIHIWVSIMVINLTLTSVVLACVWYSGIHANRPSSELFLMHREALSPIFTFVQESIAGKAVIRAFGADQRDRMSVQFAGLLDHVTRITWAIWCFESWLSMRALLMENAISGVLLVGLICFGHDADDMRPATIGLLLLLLLNLRTDLKNVFLHWNALEKDLVCLQRVFEFIHLEPEIPCNPELPPALLVDPVSWPRNGSVSFVNVDFQYSQYIIPGHQLPATAKRTKLPLILRDVHFHVQSGEKIGIVGRSGAGKSSIAMALLRVNNPTTGVITLDGIDITRVDLHVLRSKVSYLPPNPVFCSGSVREYLDPFAQSRVQNLDDFTLWSVLGKTGLKPSIRRVPKQLDAALEEVVYAWSNGERQLLCLARALLLKARVIFLDEATTATDQETDFSVQSVVCQSLEPDMTLLCISHRIDAVLKLDKLLVVSEGSVAGFGTVEELVASGDGEFFDLLESAQLVY